MHPLRPVGLVHVLAIFVLSAASSPAASDDQPRLSSNPRVNHARALIEDGRFAEARASNAQLYDYRRIRAELQFERQF